MLADEGIDRADAGQLEVKISRATRPLRIEHVCPHPRRDDGRASEAPPRPLDELLISRHGGRHAFAISAEEPCCQ